MTLYVTTLYVSIPYVSIPPALRVSISFVWIHRPSLLYALLRGL
jgi:hypothetical protein